MEPIILEGLTKLSLTQLEQLLDALTERTVRMQAQSRPAATSKGVLQ